MLGACVPPDPPNMQVSLPAPYNGRPAPANAPIEAGAPVKLDAIQQEAVVSAVVKWMKDPKTVSFSEMAGARNGRGWITVCGGVNGRNSKGSYVGMAPFIGVLMGRSTSPDFVVVQIAAFGKARAEVEALCRESGITRGV